jgi:hypothetical protein
MAPKLRKIEAAPFRDRIVHQAIAEVIEPLLDPKFYHHSYACRSGRGTHRALQVLKGWITKDPKKHYLQMDVSKYFPSIDRDILFQLLENTIADARFLTLLKALLDSSPGKCGIPIGNLTSQIFANAYLNEMDQFIKRELHVKRYIRYMDDIVLIGDREQLREWKAEIERFGAEKLRLRFHPHKVALAPIERGISFVGYRVFPYTIRIRSGAMRRFRRSLRNPATLDAKVKKLMSYESHLRHAPGHAHMVPRLRKIAFSGEAWLP